MTVVLQVVLMAGLAGQTGADESPVVKSDSTSAPVTPAAASGKGRFNFNTVQPVVFDREKKAIPDIWVLDYTFRAPRYIMADIPAKGRKLLWYMRYYVVNHTGKPRDFYPVFTLVTDKGKVYKDVTLPRAERAVMSREGGETLLNSVTMSATPIPATPSESTQIMRHGVAFWEDVDPETKSFSIFVSGLSNGYVRLYDEKAQKEVLRKKTLQLKFRKLGDQYFVDEKEFRLDGDPIWDYR